MACLPYVLVSLFFPSNVLVLPLFRPGLAFESAQSPFDVFAVTFFLQKAFGRTLEVYKKATFDPHQILCFSLEMVDLNMSATSPS